VFSQLKIGSLGIPLLLLLLLALMTIRVPPLLLDVSFTFNITLALVVLLVSVYVLKPLDFAAFPSILLVATLLRLALNVASTRVVLLDGHAGGAAAGQVIESFGAVLCCFCVFEACCGAFGPGCATLRSRYARAPVPAAVARAKTWGVGARAAHGA